MATNAADPIILRASTIPEWEKEKAKLEEEIKERQMRLGALNRKLEAAAVLAEEVDMPASHAAFVPEPAPAPKREEDEEEGDSIAEVFVANLRATSASLNVKQVRQRLADIGFGAKLKEKPNYVYGLLYRLTKSGKLNKRGSKYRAAPVESAGTTH